jgi:hypothetical protein
LALCHSTASAQNARGGIELSASLRTQYDTNVARSSEAIAQARGLEREDVRISPSLQLRVSQPAGPHLFSLTGVAGRDFHLRNSILGRENLQARAGVNSQWGRCRTGLEGSISRRQSDLEDIFLGPVDNAETAKGVFLTASCPRPAGLYPSARLTYQESDNSQVLRQDADSNTVEAEAAVNYGRPSFGEAALFARFGETRFPNRGPGTGFAGTDDQYQVRSVGIRYTRNLGSLIRGTANGEYTSVDRPGSRRGFQGFTYGASLQIRPLQRIRSTISAQRAVEPSRRIGLSNSVTKSFRGEVAYTLSPRVEFAAGGSIRDRNYELAGPTAPVLLTREETKGLFASMRIGLHDRLALEFDAQREKRETNAPGFGYTSSRVGMTARVNF